MPVLCGSMAAREEGRRHVVWMGFGSEANCKVASQMVTVREPLSSVPQFECHSWVGWKSNSTALLDTAVVALQYNYTSHIRN